MSEQPYVPPSESEFAAAVVGAYKEGREEGFMEGFLSCMTRWIKPNQNTANVAVDALSLTFQEFRSFHLHHDVARVVLKKKREKKKSGKED